MDLINKMMPRAKEMIVQPEKWRWCSPAYPPCAVCKKIIREMAVRLYRDMGNTLREIAFHPWCAFGNLMVGGPDFPFCELCTINEWTGEIVCEKYQKVVHYTDFCMICIENVPAIIHCCFCKQAGICNQYDPREMEQFRARQAFEEDRQKNKKKAENNWLE